MSPSVEYPLAITDMEAVCHAKHGGISVLLARRVRHRTSDSAAVTRVLQDARHADFTFTERLSGGIAFS